MRRLSNMHQSELLNPQHGVAWDQLCAGQYQVAASMRRVVGLHVPACTRQALGRRREGAVERPALRQPAAPPAGPAGVGP